MAKTHLYDTARRVRTCISLALTHEAHRAKSYSQQRSFTAGAVTYDDELAANL